VCDAIIVGGGHIWIKCSDISGREGMECDCGGVRTLPVHLGGHPPLMLEVFAPLSPFSLPPSFSSLFSNFSFESSPQKNVQHRLKKKKDVEVRKQEEDLRKNRDEEKESLRLRD